MALAAATMNCAAQTVYFDFGGSGSRGTLTENPDASGNHWNNIAPATEGATSIAAKTSFDNIVDRQGADTGISLFLCNAWGVNGNSGGGGLANPDAALLGDLAVASATIDYMFNTNNSDGGRSFVIRGLDSGKGYRFTIFGSRSAGDTRQGRYSISGQNGWATVMQVAGNGIGANGENQNTDNAPVSDIIYPDASGNITIYITNETTTYVPLSCMKMEAVEGRRIFEGTTGRTLLFDFGSNGSNAARGTKTEGNWNNIVNGTADNYCAAGSEFAGLVDNTGADTGMTLTVNSRFSTNGGSGGGGLANPDASLLGDLAVATATNDYFYTETGETNRTMTFSGLDPRKSYRFTLFGTRNNAECRVGLFHLEGINEFYGAQQVAGNAFTSSASQNTKNLLISDPIFPTSDGTITLTVINNAKTYVALSAMKMEELSGIERPDIRSYKSVTLSGENLISGEISELTSIDRANWQVWAKLPAGNVTLTAIDENDATSTLNVNIPSEGIYRLNVNLDEGTTELFEATYFCVEGSAVGGWNTEGVEMTYIGAGKWNFNGLLEGYDRTSDSGRINFVMNRSWNYQYKRVAGSPDKLSYNGGSDIPLNPGTYDITVDLNEMTWKIANGLDGLDPYRITVMGSSVSNGQGADNNEGYAFMYDKLLAERHASGQSDNEFYISNIAINGNSTVSLLNRYDDLEREFGQYVIFAVSLGNEGIHGAADQQGVYDQFLANMQTLISKAREDGKTPVVMNNYTRADFNADDYTYIIRMNDEIAAWDVPSVNMLGAIDDGAGHWAPGYDIATDIYHPNTDGHREFFYSMPPSLFDALASGKTLTMDRVVSDEPYALDGTISFKPEGTVHSFTLALTASMAADGILATATCADGRVVTISRKGSSWELAADGKTVATVAAGESLDNIMLTHNYASKTLALVVNGKKEAATGYELSPADVVIGEKDNKAVRRVGELMFYRSSMLTNDPFASSKLNKSSLEIYAPMQAESRAVEIPNLAMSTNTVTLDATTSGIKDAVSVCNDFTATGGDGQITITSAAPATVQIATLDGSVVRILTVDGTATVGNIAPGFYLVNRAKVMVK